MVIFSKREERFLKYVGFRYHADEKYSWKYVLYGSLSTYAHWFVSLDHIYKRGLDIEALTLALSGDARKAWDAAEPYYRYARQRGHADSAYRIAQHAEEIFGVGELIYGCELERAARLGHAQARREFVERYDKIMARTITRDVWRRKQRQEKLYRECCRTLAEEGDPQALWDLGNCYLFGSGVKKDEPKGLIMRDRAIKQWEEWNYDEEELEWMKELQDSYKEEAIKEKPPAGKYFWKLVKDLFSIKKQVRKNLGNECL